MQLLSTFSSGSTTRSRLTSVASFVVAASFGLLPIMPAVAVAQSPDATTTVDVADSVSAEVATTTLPDLTDLGATSTNEDTGTLTIQSIVNNTDGVAVAGDFDFSLSSFENDFADQFSGSATGTTYTLAAGTYTVAAVNSALGAYAAVFSGDCDADGLITIVAGAEATCTITNTEQPPVDNEDTGDNTNTDGDESDNGEVTTPSACFLPQPEAVEDDQVLGESAVAGEPNLDTVLESAGYDDINDDTDQKDYQRWSLGDATKLSVTQLASYADYANTFGYYDADVPLSAESFHAFTGTDSFADLDTIAFAIRAVRDDGTVYYWSTETDEQSGVFDDNTDDGKDHAVAYDAGDNSYIVAFEDLDGLGDSDYQDMVVRVTLADTDCTPSEAGGDQDNGGQDNSTTTPETIEVGSGLNVGRGGSRDEGLNSDDNNEGDVLELNDGTISVGSNEDFGQGGNADTGIGDNFGQGGNGDNGLVLGASTFPGLPFTGTGANPIEMMATLAMILVLLSGGSYLLYRKARHS